MPYIDRFNILLHQDLSESLGVEFNWVKRLPFFLKITYAFLASISRYPAQFLLRFGQFIGVYIVTRRFSNSLRFLRLKTKKIIHLDNYLKGNPDQAARYHYIYTGYNRGFAFGALKKLAAIVNLHYTIFIHDLIIIYYPEYFFPVNHEEQIQWLKALLTLRPKLIVNSDTTKYYLERFATEYKRNIHSIETIHIGVEPVFLQSNRLKNRPENNNYFVVISTIEPRKNHLLLLNIWREMVTNNLVNPPPHLYLIGKRGWENENIIDMVERCRPLKNMVHELSALNDLELIELLTGSRALLYPSFCEGWGMPVAEAMSLGTPTICSDIPELRESGQNIPDYINPIDGKKWMETIIDYCSDDSVLRNGQLDRIQAYRPPTWEEHFAKAYTLMTGEPYR